MKNILVSLCYPTRNRSSILEQCLRHILGLPCFDDTVQIVIADNASTDNTKNVVRQIIRDFPDKNIKYYRQAKNIGLKNWQTCLEMGDGVYCKLLNDYTYFNNDTLQLLKESVSKYKDCDKEKVYLSFIANVRDWNSKVPEKTIKGINQYILSTNNKLTWVTNFGCFKEQVKELSQYDKYADKLLDTLYWQLHFAKSRETCVLVNITGYYCCFIPQSKRDITYNFFTPHVVWYYEIISQFTKLTPQEYKFDRARLITDFVGESMKQYLIRHENCAFDLKGSWHILFKYFYDIPSFYRQILEGYFENAYQHVKNITIKLGLENFARKVTNKPKRLD